MGVELLDAFGALPGYPGQPNSEYHRPRRGSESAGDNIRGQKENSPDRQLRPLISAKFLRKSNCHDSQYVGLEAAII
jgi:hypothetical protein